MEATTRSAARRLPCSNGTPAFLPRALRGFTLVEVVISMLITAVTVSTVFSVAISTKRTSGKADRKLIANESARQLVEQLDNFVTADYGMTWVNQPTAGWTIQYGAVTDNCGGGSTPCYALQAGSHTLTNFLPASLSAPPYNGTITYYVSYPQAYSVANGNLPKVNVTVLWNDQ